MAEVRDMRFGLVKPVMDGLVVFDAAAPFLHRRECVVVGVRHLFIHSRRGRALIASRHVSQTNPFCVL